MSSCSDAGVKQRLGPISTKLHILFRRYLKEKQRPSVHELYDAGFKFAVSETAAVEDGTAEATNFASFCTALEPLSEPLDLSTKTCDGQPLAKKAKTSSKSMSSHSIMERFRAWGDRMAINEDGHLILKDPKGATKSGGKVILPMELFDRIVMDIHTQNNKPGQEHRSFMETVAHFGEKFTMGRRQFGISENRIKEIIDYCTFPDCSRKKVKKSKGTGKKTQLSPKQKSPEDPTEENTKTKKAPKSGHHSPKPKSPQPAPPNMTVGMTPGSFIMGPRQDSKTENSSSQTAVTQLQTPFTCYKLVMTATGYQAVPTKISNPLALLKTAETVAADVTAKPVRGDFPVGKAHVPLIGKTQNSLTRSGSLTDISHQHFSLEKKMDGSLFWKPLKTTVSAEPGSGTSTSFTIPCNQTEDKNTPSTSAATSDIITPNFQIHCGTNSTASRKIKSNVWIPQKEPTSSRVTSQQGRVNEAEGTITIEPDSSVPPKKKKKKKSKKAKKSIKNILEGVHCEAKEKVNVEQKTPKDVTKIKDVNNNSPRNILPKGLPTLQRAPIISAVVRPVSQQNRALPKLTPCLPSIRCMAAQGGGDVENTSTGSMLKSYLILPGVPNQAIPLDTMDLSSPATDAPEMTEEPPEVEPWEEMSPEDMLYKYYPTHYADPTAKEHSSAEPTPTELSAPEQTCTDDITTLHTASGAITPEEDSCVDPDHAHLMKKWAHLMGSITSMKRHVGPSCLEGGSKTAVEALKREIEYSELLVGQVRSLLDKDMQDWCEAENLQDSDNSLNIINVD